MGLALVNLLILYLSSLTMPSAVVLGNDAIPGFLALILVSIFLTIFVNLVPIITNSLKLKLKTPISMNLTYGAVNIAGIWVLSKFARYLGFGIGSFWVAIILGVILTILEYLLWVSFSKKK